MREKSNAVEQTFLAALGLVAFFAVKFLTAISLLESGVFVKSGRVLTELIGKYR